MAYIIGGLVALVVVGVVGYIGFADVTSGLVTVPKCREDIVKLANHGFDRVRLWTVAASCVAGAVPMLSPGWSWSFKAFLVFFVVSLGALAEVDVRERRLPASFAWLLFLVVLVAIATFFEPGVWMFSVVVSLLIIGAIVGLTSVVSTGETSGLGGGDVRLLFVAGCVVGCLDPVLVPRLVVVCFISGIVANQLLRVVARQVGSDFVLGPWILFAAAFVLTSALHVFTVLLLAVLFGLCFGLVKRGVEEEATKFELSGVVS